MVNNLATSPSFIANSTACRHLAMTPLLVQSQTRNPPTCFQFHRGRFHGIDRLVCSKAAHPDTYRPLPHEPSCARPSPIPARSLLQTEELTIRQSGFPRYSL